MRPYQLLFLFLLAMFRTTAQVPATVRDRLAPWIRESQLTAHPAQPQIYWLTITDTAAFGKWLSQGRMHLISSYPSTRLAVVSASWQVIDSLLRSSSLVNFVDMPRRPREELLSSTFDNTVNAINLAHARIPSIDGRGLTVSLKENRPDTADIDLTGRYLSTPLSSAVTSAHATIMATLIAGAGNSYFTGLGAAPGSTYSSSDFATLLPDNEAAYRQYHTSVQNHSYGTAIENYYGADAAAYDATANHDTTLLHIFSAGNSGTAMPTTGYYSGLTGYANITGSFKMAKNILVAGSVDSFYRVPALSSGGPAYDGRIKPELAAFGEDGSSGAAALISGTALLLQQQFREDNGHLPASALVKAVLVNTAGDVGAPGPDFRSGFGNLNAWQALTDMHNRNYDGGSLQQGQTRRFALHIPPGSRLLKVTLCWNDPVATANAATALVNDLDLLITDPSGTASWRPWVLNSAPSIDSLQQPAQRKRDSLNNIEQVTIADPPPGDYSINISGYRVSGDQPFSFTWHIDTANTLDWYSPAAGDHLYAGGTAVLRWQSGFVNSNATLDYSFDGMNWRGITDTLHTATGYYRWQTPDTFALAKLRMTVNGISFLSGSFALSSRLATRVGFNCSDSFLISWKKPAAVDSFILYELNGPYLSAFTTVKDTSITLSKKDHPARYYTVAPLLPQGKQGFRSFAFDYTTQGAGCYINSFLADLITNTTAQLYLELGTLYDIKQVIIEKYTAGSFVTWKTVNMGADLSYSVIDPQLRQGANTYRARIVLADGHTVFSDIQTVYATGSRAYLLFPNPVRGDLHIVLSAPGEAQFVLFNAMGQQVMQQVIMQPHQQLSVRGLKKGVYFYLFRRNGKKEAGGSLVVQ